MTGKEKFFKEIDEMLKACPDLFGQSEESFAALDYYDSLKSAKKEPKIITPNGAKILKFMQENYELYNNVFNSKGIGESIDCGSRTVSGSMQKLKKDGFVKKIDGNSPVSYSITDKGISFVILDEYLTN